MSEGDGNGSGNASRGYATRAKDLLNRSGDLLYREENGDLQAPAMRTGSSLEDDGPRG